MSGFVVADIGGTTLRIGMVAEDFSSVHDVRRVPTEGLARYPGAAAADLQRRVLTQLTAELSGYLESPPGSRADAVGLSFAGPMTADGVALAAPTIWGDGGAPLQVGDELSMRLGVPVMVANDITAAAWRYAATETEPFCLITVSSGIGSKVFRQGEVLVDTDGFGGELGHWRVDPSPDAVACDCGGRGHLGGIASGRGVLLAVRRAAAARPREFARSLLADAAAGQPDEITNQAVAAAVRAGDDFTSGLVREALRTLAMAVGSVFAAIGVRRYLFIGGFAVGCGPRFIELLGDELVQLGCFGLSAAQARSMLALGAADDDHSLIGLGGLLNATQLVRK